MSEGGSTPFTPAGGLTVDFVALLLLGRERGYLTPDDLISVMESVELTPALIAAAIGQVQAEGIEWRDDTELYSDTDLEEALDAGAGAFEVEADTGEDADPALVHNGVLSPDAVERPRLGGHRSRGYQRSAGPPRRGWELARPGPVVCPGSPHRL